MFLFFGKTTHLTHWQNWCYVLVEIGTNRYRHRVNTDILGIRELNWTGMGEFNSDDIISTTVGKNPLEEMK